jgi:hypothetical protein
VIVQQMSLDHVIHLIILIQYACMVVEWGVESKGGAGAGERLRSEWQSEALAEVNGGEGK